MTVDVVLGRQHRGLIGRIRVDMEDTSFLVVDPDDSMCRHDGSSARFSAGS
jgi:hypothetical protein